MVMFGFPIFSNWLMLGLFTVTAVVAVMIFLMFVDYANSARKTALQMAALGEVAEPREQTSFGSPPQGPEVALDLDSNRFAEGPASAD
jgi:hypothetical protein